MADGGGDGEDQDDFPWSLGVFDAHCHPTDTMSSIPDISKMSARTLTVMATRAQDQQLVADVADTLGLSKNSSGKLDVVDYRGIVPCFGWHPWFSHQIYDDADDLQLANAADDGSNKLQRLTDDSKVKHYQSVLDPAPEDREFMLSLPQPRSLDSLITETSQRLHKYPLALIGEVGLDKAFRIPESWLPEQIGNRDDSLTPGGREGRLLSPYRVSLDHQKKVLLAQLRLAGRMRRAVSVHGVQAHGHLYETLRQTWHGHEKQVLGRKKQQAEAKQNNTGNDDGNHRSDSESSIDEVVEYPPRVCLHSYSGPPDTIKLYLHPSVPCKMFFSFSTAINFSTAASKKTEKVIQALPNDHILIESDLHIAGDLMDHNLKLITEKICTLRGWSLDEGVKQLGRNWKEFVFGDSV